MEKNNHAALPGKWIDRDKFLADMDQLALHFSALYVPWKMELLSEEERCRIAISEICNKIAGGMGYQEVESDDPVKAHTERLRVLYSYKAKLQEILANQARLNLLATLRGIK